ncbi:unnamed protein product [Aphanomyces euteiches]|uniref:DDE-1 domain-containing protein n=1 Tax=Aphanomyces euteiches TaxID=100861 RepID=A0A6G0X5Z0_9STRA|nr:hypothetical protein Ae201684_008103 [Aphanomyces euteiches]KAH9074660.1 hypothetical protein Ae201684P_022462 [Aphanomyces euteiches]
MSIRAAAEAIDVPYSCVSNWKREQTKLLAFKGNKNKAKNLPGAGRKQILPDPEALLDFMNCRRHQERALTCTHMIQFLKRTQHQWLEQYLARQKAGCGYDNLHSVLQDFCTRNGYSYQQACPAKRTISDLVAELFHKKYGMYTPDREFNVDETAIQFNMAPRYIWSPRGGNANLASGEKHSYRMTAVLTIRADGLKLPILFVIRGAVGGIIDTKEVPHFPTDHFYAMQKKAWMDSEVWQQYLWCVLGERVQGKSVLVLSARMESRQRRK